jgi:hypothetical protein
VFVAGMSGGSGGPTVVRTGPNTEVIGATGRLTEKDVKVDSRGRAYAAGVNSLQVINEVAKTTKGSSTFVGAKDLTFSASSRVKSIHITGIDLPGGSRHEEEEEQSSDDSSEVMDLDGDRIMLGAALTKFEALTRMNPEFLKTARGAQLKRKLEKYEQILAQAGSTLPQLSSNHLQGILRALNLEIKQLQDRQLVVAGVVDPTEFCSADKEQDDLLITVPLADDPGFLDIKDTEGYLDRFLEQVREATLTELESAILSSGFTAMNNLRDNRRTRTYRFAGFFRHISGSSEEALRVIKQYLDDASRAICGL